MSDEELSPEEALLKRQRKEKKDLQVLFTIKYSVKIRDNIFLGQNSRFEENCQQR